MTRKIYYYILLIGLGLISTYFFFSAFLYPYLDIRLYNVGRLKDLFIILILIYETINARKFVRVLNTILFPIFLIGWSFMIMHWPGGKLMFLSSLMTIIMALVINAAKLKKDRRITLIILFLPVFHLLGILFTVFHLPIQALLRILEYIVMGLIAIAVGIKLFSKRDN